MGGRFWGSVFGRGVFGGLVLAGRVGGVVLSGAGWADLGLRVAWRGDLRLWAADLGFGTGWRPAAFLGPVWRLWRIVKMGKGSDVIWGAPAGGLLVGRLLVTAAAVVCACCYFSVIRFFAV